MTNEEQYKKLMGYVPINATAAASVDLAAHNAEVEKEKANQAVNPTTTMGTAEKQQKYGDIIAGTNGGLLQNTSAGYYTNDAANAQRAQGYGAAVTPTTYNELEGYYQVKAPDRVAQAGTSQADESHMSDGDYAIIQQLKKDYEAAIAAGDTAAAQEAHREAERIRMGYGYLGGSDGSQYLTLGELGLAQNASQGASAGFSGSTTEDYLRQMYGAMTDAQLAELKAAYEKNLEEIERGKVGLEESYQNARNQTAGAADLARRNFNEYAAAQGLNSGTGGQAELARNVTLQNNLNALNAEEAQAFADLELARTNAETEYNLAVAQAEASGQYELAAALYEEGIRTQEMLAAQQEAILAQAQAQQSQLAGYGESWLKSGAMPSAEMLQAMGLTEADAQAYINALVSNSNTGAAPKSKMNLTTAKQAAAAGVFDDDVLAVLRENGYSDAMLRAIYGYGKDYTGDESILNLKSPAVKTAKMNIDRGIWSGETLLQAIEAVAGKTITEDEALAILTYAGL